MIDLGEYVVIVLFQMIDWFDYENGILSAWKTVLLKWKQKSYNEIVA